MKLIRRWGGLPSKQLVAWVSMLCHSDAVRTSCNSTRAHYGLSNGALHTPLQATRIVLCRQPCAVHAPGCNSISRIPASCCSSVHACAPTVRCVQGMRVYHDELIAGDVRLVMIVPSWFPKAHVAFDWGRVQEDRVSVVFVLRGTMQVRPGRQSSLGVWCGNPTGEVAGQQGHRSAHSRSAGRVALGLQQGTGPGNDALFGKITWSCCLLTLFPSSMLQLGSTASVPAGPCGQHEGQPAAHLQQAGELISRSQSCQQTDIPAMQNLLYPFAPELTAGFHLAINTT